MGHMRQNNVVVGSTPLPLCSPNEHRYGLMIINESQTVDGLIGGEPSEIGGSEGQLFPARGVLLLDGDAARAFGAYGASTGANITFGVLEW